MIAPADLIQLMKEAGFPDSELDTGLKVAMAESGLNPAAHNGDASTGDDSYGLFQINMFVGTHNGKAVNLGPGRRKQFGISKNSDLFDPRVNVKAAYSIWKSSGWNAWSTYKTGKYKESTVENVGDSIRENGKAITDKLNPISGVSDAVNNFGQTIIKTGTNFAGIAVALVFLVVGVIFLIRSSDTVKNAIGNVAGKVSSIAPAGKVATIAGNVRKVAK